MKTPKEIPVSWSDAHSREKRKYRRVFLLGFLIAAYFIFVAGAWAVIYSPLFKIKSIEISGNKNVSNDDIMTLAKADIFHGSVIKRVLGMRNVLIWPGKFSDNVLEYYPEIKSASVAKNYISRKITISVEERQPFGTWCLRHTQTETDKTQTKTEIIPLQSEFVSSPPESACWWFDRQGFIFKRAIGMEGSIFTVVDDYSQKTPGLRSKILPDGLMKNAFSVFRAITASGLRVKEIRLNDLALEEMEVDTYDGLPAESSLKTGPKVYFSLRFPADSAPDVINSLKQKSIFGGLQYVDFRVENRVYYK